MLFRGAPTLLLSILLLSSTKLASAAYANPGACSGDCGTHDPAVTRRVSDGRFYRFSTNNFISIASAPNIAGPWRYLGQALPGGSKISGFSGVDLWAPDVIYKDGLYYLYYSVSSFGSQNSAIGVATSTTMDPGTWVDHGTTGVSSRSGSPYNAIDSNVVKTDNGFYMSFGSFWGDIYQIKMDNNLLNIAGSSYQVAWTSFGNGAMEGAFIYYRSGSGYYYLFTSWGNCCQLVPRPPAGTEYHMRVCRSASATSGFVSFGASLRVIASSSFRDDGPLRVFEILKFRALNAAINSQKSSSLTTTTSYFVKYCRSSGGTIVLQSHDYVYAPGHGGVIDVPGVGAVLYYHYVNNNQGANQAATYFGWNVLDWPDDWPVVGTGGGTPATTTSRATQPTSTPGNGGTCSPLYGQCGGQNFNGPKCCSSGTSMIGTRSVFSVHGVDHHVGEF
ncbi:hypothetical protein TWF106_003912 [Orbilia oligospora]|uniref:Endo-1,5-alpha-L-arabinanase A n=1 Tax=Orbilia oligospora TaxID=2813651 RepID=A0A6G1MFX1_ORBOL|nr:hypothetical protein TWF106_003912 [Orbilia oligospora]KAF3231848.1 hypothetical protein TWF191_003827 [Orbilia oligospora]KAF3255787.1 hypothetical protein TWF192_002227 [Orbilia oligospora]